MPVVIDLPKDRLNKIKLADWMEINALLDRDRSSSIEDLTSRLKIEYANERSKIESVAADVSTELMSRGEKVGTAYPFQFNGKLVIAKSVAADESQWVYLFCLLVSYIGLDRGARELKVWKTKDVSALFETICTLAARNFLSCERLPASALQFGAPRMSWRKELRPFNKALEFLRAELKEGSIRGNPTSIKRKDAGLDVIAWRPFPDKRASKLFLLGQCAAGSDYRSKRRELRDFFLYYSLEVGIIFAFFVPHEVDEDDWSYLYIPEVGISFDRSRIAFYGSEWNGKGFKKQLPTILNGLRTFKQAL